MSSMPRRTLSRQSPDMRSIPHLQQTIGNQAVQRLLQPKAAGLEANNDAVRMNQDLESRAFRHGLNIYFGAGQYKPKFNEGKRLIANKLAHVVEQQAPAGSRIALDQTPETKAAATPVVKETPAAEKTDEELAADIMNTQLAILVGWDTALQNFDKVLTSASDKETKPNFNKVIKSFLEDKLMGEIISRSKVPGASDAFVLLGKLTGEMKRASAASESATLRDFYVQHKTAVGKLQQSILALKSDFVTKVRQTRERMESAEGIAGTGRGSKGQGAVTIARSPESDVYGLMRMHLVETIEHLNNRLKISTPEDLFRALSEQWIRLATIRGGMGIRFPAFVIIRLKKDYSIINAEIQGAGGQKIAEQLLKDSPNGVDVFSLKVKRRIVVYADNGWPSASLSLDANNKNINTGSFAEGRWRAVERFVMTNGLPPTKNLKGD